jgi:predicted peptidase
MMLKSILGLFLVLLLTDMYAQQDLSAFGAEYDSYIYKSPKGDVLRYRILLPEDYDSSEEYPVVLFLHGAGERGSDNEQQLVHGSDLFLNGDIRKEYPAIVIFPQCPRGKTWAEMKWGSSKGGKASFSFPLAKKPGKMASLVMGMMKKIAREEAVDKKRIYVMGLSMGGFGTFEMLYYWPNYFAAAVPICGGHNPEGAVKYAEKVPVWIFHGGDDDVVVPEYSREMYKTLKEQGADVKYTEFPGVKHNSWDNTFETAELLPWLFSHKRGKLGLIR